jgi:hypothetical protein
MLGLLLGARPARAGAPEWHVRPGSRGGRRGPPHRPPGLRRHARPPPAASRCRGLVSGRRVGEEGGRGGWVEGGERWFAQMPPPRPSPHLYARSRGAWGTSPRALSCNAPFTDASPLDPAHPPLSDTTAPPPPHQRAVLPAVGRLAACPARRARRSAAVGRSRPGPRRQGAVASALTTAWSLLPRPLIAQLISLAPGRRMRRRDAPPPSDGAACPRTRRSRCGCHAALLRSRLQLPLPLLLQAPCPRRSKGGSG